MEARQLFKTYGKFAQVVAAKEREIEALAQEADNIRGRGGVQRLSAAPVALGGWSDTTADKAVLIIDNLEQRRRRLEAEVSLWRQFALRVEGALGMMEPDIAGMLRMYYCQGECWEYVAQAHGYSLAQTKRRAYRGLELAQAELCGSCGSETSLPA